MNDPITSFDDPHGEGFFVSCDNRLLDLRWLTATLLGTGWGAKWTHETIPELIQNSLCFGVYERDAGKESIHVRDRQVGFCRIVTDTVTFSWLADCVIDEDYRGRGLGKFLVRSAIAHPSVKRTRCFLKTQRPEFYGPIGFAPCETMCRLSDLE